MTYATKIELIGQSALFHTQWKVRIKKRDYTGAVEYHNVPASSPFVWKKDSADTVRGTSFDLAINATTDFQFLDLYTCDTKEYQVELLDDTNTVVWIGFLLPEQYQETYKPAPNVVRFSASDGMGLLKETTYTAAFGGTYKTLLAIVGECLAFTELSLPYSIAISIKESNQTANRSVLSEVRHHTSVYHNQKCYDVINTILGMFNATITQDKAKWLITDALKNAVRLNYNASGAFVSVGSVAPTVVLGQLGNTGTILYPTGSPLEMSMATSYKSLKISDSYGTKIDMLPGSLKDDWTNDTTLPDWYPFGTTPITVQATTMTRRSAKGNYFFSVENHIDSQYPFDYGVNVSLPQVEYTMEQITFEFEIGSFYGTNVFVTFILTDGTNLYSLTKTGWLSGSHSFPLDKLVPSTLEDPKFTKVTLAADGFPISGTLTISITLPSNDNVIVGTELLCMGFFQNVSLMQYVSGAAQSGGEERTITLNKSTSAQSKEVKINSGQVPVISNAKHLFRNLALLSGDVPVSEWETSDISSTTLLNILSALYASDNRNAKQILKGTIRGENIDFDSIIQINYPYTRLFEFTEFSYDLIADICTVTLSEILPYVETTFTIEVASIDAGSTGPSSSASSGSISTPDILSIIATQKAIANGLATLNGSGVIPSTQLPSYVDDVLEYSTRTSFPSTGETGKIYIATDTNITWRWSGSTYIQITSTDHTHANKTALDNVSGVNTGDETTSSIKSKLGISTLSGSNTGDQDISGMYHSNRAALDNVSGTNSGDETTSSIKSKLGISTLSGSNTGDQDISAITDATSENTANKIVKRDSNGGFASGAQIVQAISKTEGSFSAVQEVFQIKITSGAVKWYIAISATDELQFRNASGVIAAVLDQSGNLKVKGEVTAHDTSI